MKKNSKAKGRERNEIKHLTCKNSIINHNFVVNKKKTTEEKKN